MRLLLLLVGWAAARLVMWLALAVPLLLPLLI